MKLRLKNMVCALLLILPLSFLLTCAQQTDPAKMKIQQLLAQGKTQIGTSNFADAMVSFQTILDSYDPENADAMYGVALSSTLKQLAGMSDQFKSIFDMLFKTIGSVTSEPTGKLTPQATSGVNAIIESVVDDAFLNAINATIPYWDKLKQHPEFSMDLDSVPLTIGVAPYMVYKIDLGGVADVGTVYFLSATFRVFKSMIYIMYSMNFDITNSFSGLITQFLPFLQGKESLTISRDFILGLLAFIIDSSPKFMTLEPYEGKQRLSDAADNMATAIQDLLNCLDTISSEKVSQANHVIAYKFENDKKYMVFNFKDKDGVAQVVPIEFTDDVRTSFQNLISSLQSSGGVRASWSRDLAPFLGLLFQGLLQAGMLDPVVSFALPMLQPYLGADTVGMINQLMGTVKELAKGGLVSGAITTIIPDVIEFDLGQFFHSPPDQYYRLILPATVEDTSVSPPTYKLLAEYECTDLAPTDLWCTHPEAITDTDHFVGTQWYIPKDGVKSALPYLSSTDPSLGGLIYMDLSAYDTTFPDDWHRATSFEFNYFLGKAIGGLLSGIGNLTSSPGMPAIMRKPSGD